MAGQYRIACTKILLKTGLFLVIRLMRRPLLGRGVRRRDVLCNPQST
jgi:hypothetical protein